MMSGIRGKDTSPEMILRRSLHKRGVRYRLHDKSLPGKPDLKLTKRRALIFVHGCYWHQHSGCHWCTLPGSDIEYWHPKLAGNVQRDARHVEHLTKSGWRVGVVWECALRRRWRDETLKAVLEWLNSNEMLFETPVVRGRDLRRPE
jgi:DNA mismatch endonuclease (patch repair protein)